MSRTQPFRLLLVNALPIDRLGGVELGVREFLRRAPPHVETDVRLPDADVDVHAYDAIKLVNLRPEGGLGEAAEAGWAELWAERLARYRGFSVRSEHDIHPCAQRSGTCVDVGTWQRLPCSCGPRIARAFELLYSRCTVVRFVSPGHERLVRTIIPVRTASVCIAPTMDLTQFTVRVPPAERANTALIVGDNIRVAPTAERRAREAGYEPVYAPYLATPYEEMCDLFNRHRAVVVDPIMYHACARVVVEAELSGCVVLTGDRVGTRTWPDPVLAFRESAARLWQLFLEGRTFNLRLRRWRARWATRGTPVESSSRS